jgi:hypothetical protein
MVGYGFAYNPPYKLRSQWKVTLKVHSVMQDSYDFDRCFWGHPVHQEVTSTPTVSCNVDRAKAHHDLISCLVASDIGTFGKFPNRVNERLLIDTRLSRAEIFSAPFDDIRKVEFCCSAEADAPFPLGHWWLAGSLGNDLLREVVQIGFQVLGISKFLEFASIQRSNAEASRCSQGLLLAGILRLALLHQPQSVT